MPLRVDELSALSLFRGEPRAAAALAKRAIEVRFQPDEVMFLAGNPPRGWYVVLEGRVRVVRGAGARQHVIHVEEAGGTLGEVPMFGNTVHPATGIAAEPTRCALFDRKALEAAMAECPTIAFIVNRRLALRVKRLVERLDERARSVRSRLAEFLLDRHAAAPQGKSLSIGMTQHALAEELGTAREVVSRELRALVRARVLGAIGGGRYVVLDAEALHGRVIDDR